MTEIQFHFDPVPETPNSGGKFPWGLALIGLGLLTLVVAFAFAISKAKSDEIPSISGEEPPMPNNQTQDSETEPHSDPIR